MDPKFTTKSQEALAAADDSSGLVLNVASSGRAADASVVTRRPHAGTETDLGGTV